MHSRRNLLTSTLAVAALGAAAPLASAQDDFPNKPLTIIVPHPAGGVPDIVARSIGKELSARLSQPVIVDNRAGANGNIGSTYVARTAPADGYTILVGSTSTLAINPHIQKSMPFDPLKDLQPLTLTHEMPNVLLASTTTATPFRSVAEVVKAAKAKPGSIAYGSNGLGNSSHIAGVLFAKQAGIELIHVPYRGGPPAVSDLMAGQIPLMFHSLPAVGSLKGNEKVRVLAVTDTKRSPYLPDVPTFAELGYPEVVIKVWSGLFVRKGTPAPIVQRLSREIRAVLEMPSVRKPLEAAGYVIVSSTPSELEVLMRRDTEIMGKLVQDAGIQPE